MLEMDAATGEYRRQELPQRIVTAVHVDPSRGLPEIPVRLESIERRYGVPRRERALILGDDAAQYECRISSQQRMADLVLSLERPMAVVDADSGYAIAAALVSHHGDRQVDRGIAKAQMQNRLDDGAAAVAGGAHQLEARRSLHQPRLALGHEPVELRAAAYPPADRIVDRGRARESTQQGGAIAAQQPVEVAGRYVGRLSGAGRGAQQQEQYGSQAHTDRKSV